MGYNGEDVRSRCDVCAVGSMWAASARCKYSSLFTYGAHADAHDESPVSGDGTRSYGVVQDDFCVSELEAVWYMGDGRVSIYGMKARVEHYYLDSARSIAQNRTARRRAPKCMHSYIRTMKTALEKILFETRTRRAEQW